MRNILIVEDDIEDMNYCTALIGELNIKTNILRAGNGENAIEILMKNDIDIIFIDVNLPDMTGFELAEKIRAVNKYSLGHIVFVTAVADKQLQAYKTYHCYDYITKPIDPKEFLRTVKYLLENIEGAYKLQEKKKVIYVETENTKRIIDIENILFIESVNRYIDIYTETEKIEKVKFTLKEILDYIDSIYFIRCHKSFVVNLKQIKSLMQIEPRAWAVNFKKNIEYPCFVGRTYRKTVEEKFMSLITGYLNE